MDGNLEQSRNALIQAFGRQSSFWGLGKTAGEMYAVLYFSPEPVSLEEIAKSLQVTKGNVSIAIRQLEQLGMVRRSWQKGDRRVFFEPETDFYKITRSVLGLRHKPEFDQSFLLVEESVQLAKQADSSNKRHTVLERLNMLQEFYRLLDSVVEVVSTMNSDQLKAAAEMFKLLAPVKQGDKEYGMPKG